MTVNLRGAATATTFVTNIDYDAKGQRVLIDYGNNTATALQYDPLTFRFSDLTTNRAGFPQINRLSRRSLIPTTPSATSPISGTTPIFRTSSFSATGGSRPVPTTPTTPSTG